MNMPITMTIAGSDSGAGAGIQADLKTISALKGYGVSVITALTAQNTLGVDGIFPIPIDFIEKQFRSIINDFDVSAIKTGMLQDNSVINCIANLIKQSKIKNYVLDPVMVATSGDKLITDNTIDALTNKLFPLATIITPNILEAELLLNKKINSIENMKQCSVELLELGCEAVLLKGGHFNSVDDEIDCSAKIFDVFVSKEFSTPVIYNKPKIITKNLHGTGCTLSAALATFLSQGYSIYDAFIQSEQYISKAIEAAKSLKIGNGNGPLWHFI
jgi:hydroxymethylpyrimidine/phosphomethylpyrimidine kinase